MAKLKAPLLSLGAAGAIGKSLVFFGWKGLDVVREYVVPANPKTALQTTQRGYLTAAVAKIHAVQAQDTNPLDELDISAYSLLGSKEPTPRTWFNTIVKLWIDAERRLDIPVIYSNGTITDYGLANFSCIMYLNEKAGSELVAGKFYFGTSKTALVHPVVATVVAGVSVALVAVNLSAWMTAGVKYYMQFKPDIDDPCEGADSGIYTLVPNG